MKRVALDRRTLLRGALGGIGVAIALPSLEAMVNVQRQASAQEEKIRRLGLWFWGNGVKMPQWRPTTVGTNWMPGPSTEPLADAAIKNYVNIVSGLDVKSGNERGHHSGLAALMSGSAILPQDHPNSNYKSTYRQPTLDQQLVRELKHTTRFPSLELGVSDRVARGEGTTTTYLSHNGPDSYNPAEYNAGAAFDRIFKDVTASPNTPPVTDLSRELRRSVLDAVKTDIGRLQMRLGAADKTRLDQHLTHLRSLETRIAEDVGSAQVSCGVQTKPAAVTDSRNKEDVALRNKLMSDLLAVTLACDLTRVFSLHFSGSFGFTVYWQADATITSGHHDLTHNEGGDQPQVQRSTTFIMSQLAYLLKVLKDTPDKDGKSVLDNIAILASSDVSDGLKHTVTDYPIVVAGGGSGYLKNPGVHHRGNKENTSNVLLTVMRAAGSKIDSVGTDKGLSSTSCSEIEA